MTKPHRQKYGLGSFIKKAAKKVKKIAKSPIGKIGIGALLAGAPIGGGGWFGSGSGWGKGIGFLRNRGILGAGKMSLGQSLHGSGGAGNLFSKALGGIKKFGYGKSALLGLGAAGMALPFLGTDEDEEIIDDWSVTPSSIANIRQMARDRDPSLAFLPAADYVQSGYYTGAKGGIVGLANGGQPGEAQAEQMLRMEYQKYRNQGGTMSYQQFKMAVLQQAQAQGPMAQGQAPQGYANGELVTDESMMAETPTGMMAENIEEVQGEPTREQLEVLAMEIFQLRLEELDEEQLMVVYQAAMEQQPEAMAMQEEDVQFAPQTAPAMAAEGGLMSLGGMEKDYRNEGGFVPLGKKEKADDVPARLSKNEFVFTADAVRNAGGGDIDAGAEVMQNMMENLESGGEISEESQGAQGMYNNMQQLQTRIA